MSFTILTISKLNRYVRSLLEADANLSRVFVRGEISNFTNHYRSGHYYLSLKDENSAVKAVIFRDSAQHLPFMPENGMKVIATGRISLYERDGQYQFYIDDMQPDGVGALHVAFEQLKEKLGAEGLFDAEKKKKLPLYPLKIGVVTSPTGAALQDIKSVLARRWPVAELVIAPSLVQGDGAAAQLCEAVEKMNAQSAADVLILTRGGGSIEELWAFNDERLARAIAASHIPVVSAVGHETDFTIADFAADLRAPTPSAAAELVSPDIGEVFGYLLSLDRAMRQAVDDRLTDLKKRYETAIASETLKSPLNLIGMERMKLDLLDNRAGNAASRAISSASGKLGGLAAALESLSPLRVLARGYAVVLHGEGAAAVSAAQLRPGEDIRLKMKDGVADCHVVKVSTEQNSMEA